MLLEQILPTRKVRRVSDIRSRFLSSVSTSYKTRLLNTLIPVTVVSNQLPSLGNLDFYMISFESEGACCWVLREKKEACGFFVKLRLMENRSLIFTIVLVKQRQVINCVIL